MQDDHKQIRIDKVKVKQGVPLDDHALKGHFFEATGVHETYLFYHRDGSGVVLTDPPVVARDIDFTFSLHDMPGITWTISQLSISENDESASGKWVNNNNPNDDNGDFTAEAGPSLPEETAYSANAR